MFFVVLAGGPKGPSPESQVWRKMLFVIPAGGPNGPSPEPRRREVRTVNHSPGSLTSVSILGRLQQGPPGPDWLPRAGPPGVNCLGAT
jgi:hypothetical protein